MLKVDSSLAIELLGLLVQRSVLLEIHHPCDFQLFACLLECCKPWAKMPFGMGTLLLTHDPAVFVLHEISCGTPTIGLADFASKDLTLGSPCREGLLLHGLHGFHGLHCFHHVEERKQRSQQKKVYHS